MLDGSGDKLRSEMDAALREGEDLEIYLDLPPKDELKTAHEKASDWYDAEIRKLEATPYE